MNRQEILNWLEQELRSYPPRAAGNECEDFIVKIVSGAIQSDRYEFVEAMRQWIVARDKQTLMAVRIAKEYQLRELKGDIGKLLVDVIDGRVFSPYYQEFITPALESLR